MTDATTSPDISRFSAALPFALSLLLLPLAAWSAYMGGWWVLTLPAATLWFFSLIDWAAGLNTANPDTETAEEELFWYRALTAVWVPIQAVIIFGTLWYVSHTDHLSLFEKWALFAGIGVPSGTIGIVYAHELMHQKPAWERWLGDLLMCMVLYGHFRSEHLRVHHLWVGTPRDAVTARYGEGFHRFFPRVLREAPVSAFRAEQAMLARRKLPWWHRSNPFWRYAALQAAFLALAMLIAGWEGLFLFCTQAFYAIWQLELTNYVEHYGLTRRHLGEGRYEHQMPHHSWNAAHRVSNWLLINLQRHSDHHYKPDRRFPLLQTYDETEAPQLPYGYTIMGAIAMYPRLWKRVMNPRVRAWRQRFYPDIEDWRPYNKGLNPKPARA
ncbi:alkane 1-monooxygenase [Pseudoroseicyclus tamaricis]|uniref:Alkane 1-monooxygenase n=1 Tax=Pseudoroseicyclus tamaricis TaxID=2705421 RepID=A0A6B2JMN7_9RHOB|nr:alkane 1-monooxygenase [Pseudoroseicyclus tamaricis]NDV02863.1 alkane 1-monooxygenase [Pseudoroseicyclus tamaricis]